MIYLDDLLIYSEDQTTNDHFQKVLAWLHQHWLYVQLEIYEFDQASLKFLRSILSADGVQMNPKKALAVHD